VSRSEAPERSERRGVDLPVQEKVIVKTKNILSDHDECLRLGHRVLGRLDAAATEGA